MTYWIYQKPERKYSGYIVSIIAAVAVLVIFSVAFSKLTAKSQAEQVQNLTSTLNEACIQCYAVEGSYPESLEDLVSTYHISYNTEKYLVDYQPVGENILPRITVIARSGGDAS